MGYAIKMNWKELFIFKWLSNCQKLFLFLKNWPFLEFSDSYQSEFVVKEFNLGNSEQFWATFVKKWIWISSNFRKSQRRCLKSPILNFFMTNSDWQESENSKNGQFFKNDAILCDLTHLKMNNFFQCIFIA